MGDVGGVDHDLGRYAADIDASAEDGAALDQRDLRAKLDGLEHRRCRSRRCATGARRRCPCQRPPSSCVPC